MPNPRCLKKATFKLLRDITKDLEHSQYFNPKSKALTSIHNSKSRSEFVIFDIDQDNIDLEKFKSLVLQPLVVQTKGGYHVYVRPDIQQNKLWFPNIMSMFDVDQHGDLLSPIPGTSQGGFTPKVV